MQHNSHVLLFWDYILAEILSVLGPTGPRDGWAEWSGYAVQGEWP